MRCSILTTFATTTTATTLVALSLLFPLTSGNNNSHMEQVEWVRSKGGYFNPKLEFQNLNPTDPESPKGVFASSLIPQGEMIMMLSPSAILTSGGSLKPCDTARNLYKEYKLGPEKSEYWPYVNYLYGTKRGRIPSAWSTEGKKLLQLIRGIELPPAALTTLKFARDCDGTPSEKAANDPDLDHAYYQVQSRGWDDLLLPLFDMINHRGGNWSNADSTSAHRSGRDIFAFATKDIHPGDQVYWSYTTCTDCPEPDYTQDVLKWYGFVEQYPQRWSFPANPAVIFELEEVMDKVDPVTGEVRRQLQVTWQEEEVKMLQIAALRGYLKRLQDKNKEIRLEAKKVKSIFERDTAIEFYEATKTALQHAIWSGMDLLLLNETTSTTTTTTTKNNNNDKTEVEGNNDNNVTASSSLSFKYDKLEEKKDPLYYFSDVCEMDITNNGEPFLQKYNSIGVDNSNHQEIKVTRNKRKNDTCLTLPSGLQTCASFRPHYHEPLVHYPARYLEQVQRVIFIGGGDSMTLHEILKYPSIELVVGLELDQQVVRTSFKHFGTQPHFDDERVQWWFGDAVKSLLMLPRDYFGTFDLVLVDLETDLMKTLNVTRGVSLIDATKLLMSPEGVIARNEDYYLGATDDDTDHKVGLYFNSVPLICEQSVYMGSNSIDFFKHRVFDHKVHTFTLSPPLAKAKNLFAGWNDYTSKNRTVIKTCLDSGEEPDEFAHRSLGILMLLEVENITTSFTSSSDVQATISKALKKAGGIHEISVALSSYTEGDVAEMIFILREGYVVARVWPKEMYCAFDILLWSKPQKLDAIKAELTTILRSETFSSYRLVTGGIFGVLDSAMDSSKVGPPPNDAESESCTKIKKDKCLSAMDPKCHVPLFVQQLHNQKKQDSSSSKTNRTKTTKDQCLSAMDPTCHVPMFVKKLHNNKSKQKNTTSDDDDGNQMEVADSRVERGSLLLEVPPPSSSLAWKDSYRSVMDGGCHVPNFVGKIRDGDRNTDITACKYQVTSRRDVVSSTTEESKTRDDVEIVLEETASLAIRNRSAVVVVCGKVTDSCKSLDAMDATKAKLHVIPVWSCYNVLGNFGNDMEGAEKQMTVCEDTVLDILRKGVQRNGKIGGIVIDPNTPKTMGQILIHLVQTPGFRQGFLEDRFSVLATVQTPSEEAWRKELMERFRTGVVKFHPAYKAEVVFNNPEKSSELELAIFSAGDKRFFLNLAVATGSIEASTDLIGEVRSVKNGIKPYVADFVPAIETNDHSYDNRDALKQWLSQKPLGHQTIVQFEIKPPDVTYEKGEKVWVYRQSASRVGKIHSSKPNGKYSVTVHGEDKKRFVIGYKRIRQIKTNKDDNGEKEMKPKVTIPPQQLKGPLLDSLIKMNKSGFPDSEIRVVKDVGEGCVVVLFWATGSIILTYDGRNHIDANIFSVFDWEGRRMGNEFKKHLTQSITFLTPISVDEQPRGTGGVLNFEYELRSRKTPPWAMMPPPEDLLKHQEKRSKLAHQKKKKETTNKKKKKERTVSTE